MPTRRPNAELRRREYLTEAEVERLMEAAKGNQWGRRDAAMVLIAYRHGLRCSELVDLRWDQVDFRTATCTSVGSSRALLARIRFLGASSAVRQKWHGWRSA
jgi:integrase